MKRDGRLQQAMTFARLQAALTQAELAKLMYTKQSSIARFETGRVSPTITTLEMWAKMTGHTLEVRLV